MWAALLVSSCLIPGQDPAGSQDLAPDVRRWVRQLDDNDLANREAAEKALIEMGPKVLGLLPRATPRMPAEVKERLGRVVKVLETKLAEAAARSSLVDLSGEQSLAEALAVLEKQTGNRVGGYEQRSGQVNLELAQRSYWESLDRILDEVGLTIDHYGGRAGTLALTARPDEQLPRFGRADYQGIFRFEATRVETVYDLRSPQVRGLKLRLEISWEPRITPISLTQALADVAAVDESGGTIEVDGAEGSRSASVEADISNIEMEIPLQLPDRSVKEIASFKGRLTALVPGRTEPFEFDGLAAAENVELRKAGTSVTLERVRKNEDLYEVWVRIRFDEAANALESHRGWIFNNDAFMIDAGGHRVENAGAQTTRQDVNEVGIAYLFDLEQPLPSYKFVYRTPALIIRMPVEYELKNIPLP